MRGPIAFGPDRKLLDKPAFDRVFAQPDFRLRRHPFMLLARRREAGPARIGFVVGKKHARRAVARNRIRRIAREQFRHILGPLGWTRMPPQAWPDSPAAGSASVPNPAGLDIILMARPGAAELDGAQLAEVLRWLFERLLREAGADRRTALPGADGAAGKTAPPGR